MWKYHLKCLVTNGTLNFGLSEMCGGIGQAEGDLHQIFDQSKSLVWNYYNFFTCQKYTSKNIVKKINYTQKAIGTLHS